MTNYAIISLAGKQYRVREGQRLLVDRLPYAEDKAFHPQVLLAGGAGKPELAPKGVEVTAKVVANVLGDKVRIGKHKPKKGYRRRAGHRSHLSQVEIQKIAKKQPARKPATAKAEVADEKPKPARKPVARKATPKAETE
jgi:large subunit ribosomal protein L21